MDFDNNNFQSSSLDLNNVQPAMDSSLGNSFGSSNVGQIQMSSSHFGTRSATYTFYSKGGPFMQEVVDVEAMDAANKALSVIHLVLIPLLNGAMFLALLTRNGTSTFTCTRKMMMLAIAFSDVFLALFSLMIMTISLFDPTIDITNVAYFLVDIYYHYVWPLEYSVGLLIMAVDLIVQKDQPIKHKFLGVLLALLMYVIADSIAFPLCLAGSMGDPTMFYSQGFTLERYRATVLVCQAIPALLALIMASIAACLAKSSPDGSSNWISMNAAKGPTDYYDHTSQGEHRPARHLRQFKTVLVVVSILHFISVVPKSVFDLVAVLNPDFEDYAVKATLIAYQVVNWLMPFRSLLTSCLWLALAVIQK